MEHSNAHILLVDDSPTQLVILAKILSQQGYHIHSAKNGRVALQDILSTVPDLIFLDIQMPDMDGYEMCQILKSNEKTRKIPIIFITGLNKVCDKVKGFSLGGVDYITKPYQAEEVIARTKNHLKVHSLQQQLLVQNVTLQETLDALKTTQQELIQTEKNAALGKLVAGVAHELNTPLGAIHSAMTNIHSFLNKTLLELPQFFHSLSEEQQQFFLLLLQKAFAPKKVLSTKEKRRLKRNVIQYLNKNKIADADIIADTLVDMGIYDNFESFLPLLYNINCDCMLDIVYRLSNLQVSSHTIDIAIQRASKVVFALKNFYRHDALGEKIETNIAENIEIVLTLYQNQLKSNIKVITQYAPVPPILCYADELNQVWMNLISNALQAMHYKGILLIKVFQQEHNVLITFTDNGEGIAEEIKDKIFAPFFTTKRAGQGTGLGLDIVKKIINKHEGEISVESLPNKTTFTVILPIHSCK
ncbi:MAG: response regulator [Thiomargarita sp.]|nr:response regulator [Thiomargarita sp.]